MVKLMEALQQSEEEQLRTWINEKKKIMDATLQTSSQLQDAAKYEGTRDGHEKVWGEKITPKAISVLPKNTVGVEAQCPVSYNPDGDHAYSEGIDEGNAEDISPSIMQSEMATMNMDLNCNPLTSHPPPVKTQLNSAQHLDLTSSKDRNEVRMSVSIEDISNQKVMEAKLSPDHIPSRCETTTQKPLAESKRYVFQAFLSYLVFVLCKKVVLISYERFWARFWPTAESAALCHEEKTTSSRISHRLPQHQFNAQYFYPETTTKSLFANEANSNAESFPSRAARRWTCNGKLRDICGLRDYWNQQVSRILKFIVVFIIGRSLCCKNKYVLLLCWINLMSTGSCFGAPRSDTIDEG